MKKITIDTNLNLNLKYNPKTKLNEMSAHEYACMMGDIYSECIDIWILESKKKADKELLQTIDRCFQYALYNYFNIEVQE